jgi:hypothetical protein
MQGQSWVHEREQLMHDTFTMFGTKAIGLKQLSVIVQVLTRICFQGMSTVMCSEHSYVFKNALVCVFKMHKCIFNQRSS